VRQALERGSLLHLLISFIFRLLLKQLPGMKQHYALRPRLSTTFPITTMYFWDGLEPIIDERASYVTLPTGVLM